MEVQRVLLSVVVLLVWTCGPVDSNSIGTEDSVLCKCGGRVIPDELKETHNKIKLQLSLTGKSVGESPVFSSVIEDILSFPKYEQIVLMNRTLDVYLRILSNILHPTSPANDTRLATTDVRTAVTNLNTTVARLQTQYYSKDVEKRKEVIEKLDKISAQVNDLEYQKKALAEFKEIYTAASKIVDKKCPGSHSS